MGCPGAQACARTLRVRQDVSWVSLLRMSLRSLDRSLALLSST